MTIIKVDPNAVDDAARSLRYRGREVSSAGAALTRALGRLDGCSQYLPALPGTGNDMEIVAADLENHGDALDRFVEAVLASDHFTLDSPVGALGSAGTTEEVGLPTLASLLPGKPFQTDFGAVRRNGSHHELLGLDGQWYRIDVARPDAADFGWKVTDRDQRLGRWPDPGIGTSRLVRAGLALLGGPSGVNAAASAQDYAHVFFDEDGEAYIDDDRTNDIRLGGEGQGGLGALTPDGLPQDPPGSASRVDQDPDPYRPQTDGRRPMPMPVRPEVDGAVGLFANGVNALGVLVMPEERAYLNSLTFEQAGDDRRVVIEGVNLSSEGLVQEFGIVGWDGDTPILDKRPEGGWPAMGTTGDCRPISATSSSERSGPRIP